MEEVHCRELLGALSDYIDGNAEADICTEIERHLSECEKCRVVVDSLRKTISLYHTTAGDQTVPAGVRERLYRCLNLEDYVRQDLASE